MRNSRCPGKSHIVFKNLDTRRGIKISYARDKDVAITINTYCANSAKTGNPNGEGLPKRPAYNPQENMIMEIQADGIYMCAQQKLHHINTHIS